MSLSDALSAFAGLSMLVMAAVFFTVLRQLRAMDREDERRQLEFMAELRNLSVRSTGEREQSRTPAE